MPGTTKVKRLEENWASRNVELTKEEKREMRQIVDTAKSSGQRHSEAGQAVVVH